MVKGRENDKERLSSLKEKILQAAYPSQDELERLREATEGLLADARSVLKELDLEEVKPMIVGSVAKMTMTKDPDMDLFLIFPAGWEDKDLESDGLEVGQRLLTRPRKRYTQHPYLTGEHEGISCDIVPSRIIEPGQHISTAVDRTPLHTEYINRRISEKQRKEVVLLKSFLKGIGSYGAEDTVQGFSGYLTELLILRYGDLQGVLRALAGTGPGIDAPGGCEQIDENDIRGTPELIITFDKEGSYLDEPRSREHYARRFRKDPLVVIDPVDSDRNVASPISEGTLSYTKKAANRFIRDPTELFFHPFSKRPLRPEVHDHKNPSSRDMDLLSLQVPDGDPGIVITQLRSSLRKLKAHLEREGFEKVIVRFLMVVPRENDIDRSYLKARYCWFGDVGSPVFIVMIRTEPVELSGKYRHWGPPPDNPRVKDFKKKWGEDAKVDDTKGRTYVMRGREHTRSLPIIEDFWRAAVHGSLFKESSVTAAEPRDIGPLFIRVLNGDLDPWTR
ncbi:MAG: CCA tRNA nucleotidyltransferase [Thermoplasmatota archaeon]